MKPLPSTPRVRHALLAWYRAHHRRLPWRAERPNPYHVLVSEAMLQQTQVATVVAYFERFIAAFPDIASLAAGEEQAVLRLWQGLGYYRRARGLHAAARKIVADFAGQIPADAQALLQLPGVGRYTAGAIASIAFGKRAPLVDGNVARVLARLYAIRQSIDEPRTVKKIWALAEELVPADHPGDFNQALMELGALVCTPKNPSCLICPLADRCLANAQGLAGQLPVRSAKRAPKTVTHQIVALRRGGKLLFEQRPAKGLWSMMWQLPTAEHLPDDADAQAVGAWAVDHSGLKITGLRRAGEFTHQTTHRTIRMIVWTAAAGGTAGKGVWRRPDDLDDLPLANPQRRALELVGAAKKPAPHPPV